MLEIQSGRGSVARWLSLRRHCRAVAVSLDRLDDLQKEMYRGLCYDVASSSLDLADFQIFQSEMMDAKTGVPWP